MNKSSFIQFIESPHLIHGEAIPELQQIISDYPYFQSAHLLLTKAYHVSENLNFETTLKKTAAIAADRKKLHHLLFDLTVPAKEEISLPQNESVQTKQPEEKVVQVDETAEEDSLVENEISSSSFTAEKNEEIAEIVEPEKIAKDFDTEEKVVISEQENDLKENEATTSTFNLSEKIEAQENPSVLEQQILSSAINSSAILSVSGEIPDLDELLPLSDQKIAEEEVQQEASVNEKKENHSFSEWLSMLNGERPKVDQPFKEENETESFSQTDLSPVRTEFYSAAKMAKLSVQENDDLVTETLATIYADQGNFEKAIKAFEKLQLKYPEKSSYFAGRIKEIQIQLNS